MAAVTPKVPSLPPVRFLREVIAELRKVTWPTREDTVKLTLMVIIVSTLVGVFVGGLDVLLVRITSFLF